MKSAYPHTPPAHLHACMPCMCACACLCACAHACVHAVSAPWLATSCEVRGYRVQGTGSARLGSPPAASDTRSTRMQHSPSRPPAARLQRLRACMRACTHVCTRVCMRAHACIHARVCMCACMYACTRVCLYVRMHAFVPHSLRPPAAAAPRDCSSRRLAPHGTPN